MPRESCSMVGGDGPHSYARNSGFQKEIINISKEMVKEGIIDKLDFRNLCNFGTTSNTFCIADFGCSSGPNAFSAIANIIKAVEQKFQAQIQNPSPLEFQVFFNDVTNNDFNTLFKTLHSCQTQAYFAGVPGSFHNRLFPSSTLHFAHSSNALHWLSRVPKQVVDCNKGYIQCTGLSKEVAEAYSDQFKNDLNAFLSSRAPEIVGGGLIVILVPALGDGVLMSQTTSGIFHDILGSCLVEMANLGMINEEKVDSFNLPFYYSSAKELEEIIRNNRYFSVERMESFKQSITVKDVDVGLISSHMRALFEGLMRQHFGDEETVNNIFEYFTQKLAHNHFNFDGKPHYTCLFILKRKIN